MSQIAEMPLVLPLAGLVADASGLGVLRARRAGGRSLAVAPAAASKKTKKAIICNPESRNNPSVLLYP